MSARHDSHYRRSLLSFSAAALLAVAATAQVASIDDSGNLRQEVATCQSGRTAQDRETCLRGTAASSPAPALERGPASGLQPSAPLPPLERK